MEHEAIAGVLSQLVDEPRLADVPALRVADVRDRGHTVVLDQLIDQPACIPAGGRDRLANQPDDGGREACRQNYSGPEALARCQPGESPGKRAAQCDRQGRPERQQEPAIEVLGEHHRSGGQERAGRGQFTEVAKRRPLLLRLACRHARACRPVRPNDVKSHRRQAARPGASRAGRRSGSAADRVDEQCPIVLPHRG